MKETQVISVIATINLFGLGIGNIFLVQCRLYTESLVNFLLMPHEIKVKFLLWVLRVESV